MKSAASPPSHGLTEGKEYTLKLGSSFQNGARAQESYHVLRYDFKPASIDTTQPAEVKFSSNKECFVTYPNHDQGSITFKGGRKPCQKECILVIDKNTGEITLEKITSNIPLKKSRTGTVDRSGDIRKTANPPLNPKPKSSVKQHGSKATNETTSSSQQSTNSSTSSQNNEASHSHSNQQSQQHKQNVNKQPAPKPATEAKPKDTSGSSSSDSSSDSDSSDSDSDIEEHAKALDSFQTIPTPPQTAKVNEQQPPIPPSSKGSNILQDLQLSDSNSDSDSD